MAQPAISTPSIIAGFGTSAVAYGYAMTGTTVTACATNSIHASIYTTTGTAFKMA